MDGKTKVGGSLKRSVLWCVRFGPNGPNPNPDHEISLPYF